MRKGSLIRICALAIIIALCFIPHSPEVAIGTSPQESLSPNQPHTLTTDAFSVRDLWNTLFNGVNETNIMNIIRTISENYPRRVWYPLDKAPSYNLSRAWSYVNTTISSFTGGQLHFKLMTEQLDLVAIKNGTRHDLAPILVVGTIASRWDPGANSYASSAAAVLETARLLQPLELTNDVYYVLVNTITTGGYSSPSSGNIGIDALFNTLAAQNRTPSVLLWFSRLLYNPAGDPYQDTILARYGYGDLFYDQPEFLGSIIDLMAELSMSSMTITTGNPDVAWTRSGCYEAAERMVPGVCIGQYYYSDPAIHSDWDTWDYWYWDYDFATEATAVIASLVAYLGSLGSGKTPQFSMTGTIAYYESRVMNMPLTGNSFVNVTITWTENTTIYAYILNNDHTVVYSRVENDSRIDMDYLVPLAGVYQLHVVNVGENTTTIHTTYQHWQDFDRDSLDDYEEFIHGTNSLSSDTDADLLSDSAELARGTSPTNSDSDTDGALDGVEVAIGCDPLVNDSDMDTLLDGFEIQMGLDPTSNDTDGDHVNDAIELALGLNPKSNDTDGDGLEDWAELQIGTNATCVDSDGDTLSDLFEVLNGLDPLSTDSDNDSLPDIYEINNGLIPIDPDSDHDGIMDAEDWAPKEHWLSIVPTVGLGFVMVGLIIWLLAKRRAYYKEGA